MTRSGESTSGAGVKALVLGGYGDVGSTIVAQLRDGGDTAVAAGRDPERADRVVDLDRVDAASFDAVMSDVDVVINAAGAEDPALVSRVTARGKAFVDITATTSYVAAVEGIALNGPALFSVGLAPGLTNLLAASVNAVAPEQPIDVAVVLGAGEHHGAAAVAWSYQLLGRSFRDPASGDEVRNYSRPGRFDLPGRGTRRLYRADFSDQHTLTRSLHVPVRTYFGLSSRLATAALATLTRIPGGSRAPRGLHLPGTDHWTVLARSADGTSRWATGRKQSHATAVITVFAARFAAGLSPGVHHLHDVMTIADVPTGLGIDLGA